MVFQLNLKYLHVTFCGWQYKQIIVGFLRDITTNHAITNTNLYQTGIVFVLKVQRVEKCCELDLLKGKCLRIIGDAKKTLC